MDKFFHISERGSNVRTEIMAGLTTFFAMAYIVLVNPNQVAADGKAGWLVAEGASAAEVGKECHKKCTSFVSGAFFAGCSVIEGYQSGLVIILLSGIV